MEAIHRQCRTWRRFGTLLLVAAAATSRAASLEPMNRTEETYWIRAVMPRPHEISIPATVKILRGQVRVKTAPGASDLERAGAELLRTVLKAKTDRADATNAGDAVFSIILARVQDDGAAAGIPVSSVQRLRTCPNREQAYVVQPVGDTGLLLAGLDARGVLYAAVTVCQLLDGQTDPDAVCIPLARILDWPDLQERGLWNGRIDQTLVDRMASLKLNFLTRDMGLSVRNGPTGLVCKATFDKTLWDYARCRAVNFCPKLYHLNFLDNAFRQACPELVGKGDKAVGPKGHRVPCASNPLLVTVLAEWLEAAAAQGIMDVSVWTTEYYGQCECEKCRDQNQFALETRAIVSAWRRIRQKYPSFTIRVFSSTSLRPPVGDHIAPDTLQRILAEIPPEVRIERACFARSGSAPGTWVDPPFDAAAAKGYWVASYRVPYIIRDQLTYAASRTRTFLNDLTGRRKWRGGYSFFYLGRLYPAHTGFRVSAIAEWSWNSRGRDLREFAAAWARRKGHRDPERFADWLVLMDPILTGVSLRWTGAAAIRSAAQGKGLSGVPAKASMRRWVKTAQEGTKLAEALGIAECILDSKLATARWLVYLALTDLVEGAAAAQIDKRRIAADLGRFDRQAEAFAGLLRERNGLYKIDNPRFSQRPPKYLADFREEVSGAFGALLEK